MPTPERTNRQERGNLPACLATVPISNRPRKRGQYPFLYPVPDALRNWCVDRLRSPPKGDLRITGIFVYSSSIFSIGSFYTSVGIVYIIVTPPAPEIYNSFVLGGCGLNNYFRLVSGHLAPNGVHRRWFPRRDWQHTVPKYNIRQYIILLLFY